MEGPKSTITSLERFIEGQVWTDMLEELTIWEAAARSEYDVCEGLRELGHVQGRLEALTYLRGLPQALLTFAREAAAAKTEHNQEESEDADLSEEAID